MPAGVYSVKKYIYFSFTFTTHLAHSNTHYSDKIYLVPFRYITTKFHSTSSVKLTASLLISCNSEAYVFTVRTPVFKRSEPTRHITHGIKRPLKRHPLTKYFFHRNHAEFTMSFLQT